MQTGLVKSSPEGRQRQARGCTLGHIVFSEYWGSTVWHNADDDGLSD